MSVYEGSTHLPGGKIFQGLQETASQLLWCEHCGIALCFDCDSHCHHAKNARSAHLRVLLPSSRTSTVPRCEHGVDPVSGKCLVPQARRASARAGVDGSRSINLDLISPPSTSKDKRKRNKKKVKGSSTSSSLTDTSQSYDSKAEHGDGSVSNCLYKSEIAQKVAFRSDGAVSENGVDYVQESDISDLSFSSSPEVGSPIFLRTISVSTTTKPPRSALRGGSEDVGLGPRPKLHVKWHPDVFDPICSTVSHTVGHKCAPVFFSRRSYQKHLRQKSKASSKSHAHGKKQDGSHKGKKKGESSKSRSHVSFESLMKLESQEELSTSPSDDNFTDMMANNCTEMSGDFTPDQSTQSEQSREAVDMPYCSSLEQGCEAAVVYEIKTSQCKDVPSDRPANTSVQEKPPVFVTSKVAVKGQNLGTRMLEGEEGRKLIVSSDVETQLDDFMDVGLPESYRKALACMLHSAKSATQNDSLGATVEYDAAVGLFRDAERHTRILKLSGSEEVVKQAARGQLSTWISVV